MRIQFGKDDYIFVEVAEGARWKITNSRDGVFFADGYDGEISISVHMNSSQTEVIVIRNADRNQEIWRMVGDDRDETVSKMQSLLAYIMGDELEADEGKHFTDQWRVNTDYSEHTVKIRDHQLAWIRQLVGKLQIVSNTYSKDPNSFVSRIVDLKLTEGELTLLLLAIPKSLNPGKV